jgi:hypothetical protein
MFSDAVYLFGNTFASAPSLGDSYELPDGTRVSQKKLAEQVVLAAFAYLYHNKLINIDLGERENKFLFLKTKIKTAKVNTLQATAPDLSGLEAVLFSSLRYNEYYGNGLTHMYGLTRALVQRFDYFPRRVVLKIVKKNLLQRGVLKRVETAKVLFITTHKYVVYGDISKVEKHITELKKTLEELQSKRELYQQILSDIHDGMTSPENGDYNSHL